MAKKKRKKPAPRLLRRSCGTMAVHMMLLERFPSFRARQFKLEQEYAKRRAKPVSLAKLSTATIKVVVNVVYNTAEQNISSAQVNSQVAALNRDFGATNPDKSKVPAVWTGLVTNARIKFTLHKTTRTQTAVSSFTQNDDVKAASSGGIAPYQPQKCLNLWVCPLGNGLLGYAQFPGGPSATDGVVINYKAFGTMGTAAAPFDLGRTASHEVGHYFNLRHIWGDTEDCSG